MLHFTITAINGSEVFCYVSGSCFGPRKETSISKVLSLDVQERGFSKWFIDPQGSTPLFTRVHVSEQKVHETLIPINPLFCRTHDGGAHLASRDQYFGFPYYTDSTYVHNTF